MKNSCNLAAAVLTLAFVLPASAGGEEGGGWKLPSLNPFSRKAGPPTSAHISDSDNKWKMPNLLPTSSKKTAPAKAKSQSAWQKMSTGTRSMFAKTADVLNPFDDAKDNQPVRPTGSRNARQAAAKKNEKSGSFFPSLWGSKPEDDGPKSVNDFLSRPRLQP